MILRDPHESWDALRTANLAFAQHARHAGRRPYTAETFRLRAKVHAAALDLLTLLCPLITSCAGSALVASLVTILVSKFVPVPMGVPSADETLFGLQWAEYGFPTFRLTAGVMAQLLFSDPDKVLVSDLAWPFYAYRIQLPHPDCVLPCTDSEGRPTTIDAIHVGLIPSAANVAQINNRINLRRVMMATNLLEFQQEALCVLRQAQTDLRDLDLKRVVITRAYTTEGICLTTSHKWNTDVPVRTWLVKDVDPGLGADYGSALARSEVDDRALWLTQRVVVNLALYLQRKDAVTGTSCWSKNKASASHTYDIGRETPITKEHREVVREIVAGREPSSLPSLKHIRKGHFCNQACGPQWSEHRVIYREPVWVNPTASVSKDTAYVVK